jgi:molybdopterin converting factor small subunit
MKVLIPSPLRSYTKEREVQASGATLAEVLLDLDRQFPGIRFRMIDEQDKMRPHIRFFVNSEQVLDLGLALQAGDEVQIVQALSGGL